MQVSTREVQRVTELAPGAPVEEALRVLLGCPRRYAQLFKALPNFLVPPIAAFSAMESPSRSRGRPGAAASALDLDPVFLVVVGEAGVLGREIEAGVAEVVAVAAVAALGACS